MRIVMALHARLTIRAFQLDSDVRNAKLSGCNIPQELEHLGRVQHAVLVGRDVCAQDFVSR